MAEISIEEWEAFSKRLESVAPKERLQEHKNYWGSEPPTGITKKISVIEQLIAGRNAPNKVLLLLCQLDNVRLFYGWNADPDTIRGEKIANATSHGGKVTAALRSWKPYEKRLQALVDCAHARHPEWSYEEIKRQVCKSYNEGDKAIKGGESLTTNLLKKYTTNPRKKLV